MTRGRVPVLWITGPAGVGKSTVSWQLFTELTDSGTRTAFADADQLCMCCPAPPDDPGRDLIRARNADVVIRNCQEAGAQRVIVNGVVDPALGARVDLLRQAAVMVCRLRADPDEVVRRLLARQRASGGDVEDLVRQVRAGCDRMDASEFADVCVDTTGVPAGEVAGLVRDRCRGWPGFGVIRERPGAAPAGLDRPAGSEAHGSGGQVLLLCGPAGVGKSTIGFQLYQRCLRAGLTAGYIDNQAVLDAYAAALPAAVITACRLHAGPAELRRRIMTRGEGGSWPQPGDPLRGQPASYLSQVAEQAAAEARALEHTSLDALRIDTDGRTAGEAAELTAAAAGWPDRARRRGGMADAGDLPRRPGAEPRLSAARAVSHDGS